MTSIGVYLVDERVFKYDVSDPVKAREHAYRIVNYGWRNVSNGLMEYYPVHQVLKVVFDDPKDDMSIRYEGKE